MSGRTPKTAICSLTVRRLRSSAGSVWIRPCSTLPEIDHIEQGDEVIVFGTGEKGEPTADTLAANTDTINYEVVCLVGKRVPRIYYKNGKMTEVMYKL